VAGALAAAALVAIVGLTVALVNKDDGTSSIVAAYDSAKADQANTSSNCRPTARRAPPRW
jgi:hypothetical protein